MYGCMEHICSPFSLHFASLPPPPSHERLPSDNLDMNEMAVGVEEDNSSRISLGSKLCFTIRTTLHGTGKLTDSSS